jgi:hypothetical protein
MGVPVDVARGLKPIGEGQVRRRCILCGDKAISPGHHRIVL